MGYLLSLEKRHDYPHAIVMQWFKEHNIMKKANT